MALPTNDKNTNFLSLKNIKLNIKIHLNESSIACDLINTNIICREFNSCLNSLWPKIRNNLSLLTPTSEHIMCTISVFFYALQFTVLALHAELAILNCGVASSQRCKLLVAALTRIQVFSEKAEVVLRALIETFRAKLILQSHICRYSVYLIITVIVKLICLIVKSIYLESCIILN